VDSVFRTGRACIKEKRAQMPDGSVTWWEVRAYPISESNNEFQMVATIGRDITDKKQVDYNTEKKIDQNTLNITERQTEVLSLIAEGLTNVEIASELYLSTHTVKRHIANLFNSIGVSDRTEAAILALKHGII
jgi:DNA-binding NarL/FixJ family response regulator